MPISRCRRRAARRCIAPYQRMDAPPAHASAEPPPWPKSEPKALDPLHTMLSAPPPSATSLTPIYPTPKFDARSNAKIDATEKFSEPKKTPPLPPGYTPPASPCGHY